MIAAVRGWLAVCQVKQKGTWNIVLLADAGTNVPTSL